MKHKLYYCLLLSAVVCNVAFAQELIVHAEKRIGGNADDKFTSIIRTSDGGVLMGGYSNSGISRQKSQNSRGGNDYWIVKMDENGRQEWDKTIGGTGDDRLKAMSPGIDGGYVLLGTSNSPASGEKSENGYGSSDYWIVKVDANGNVQWDKTIGGNYIEEASSLLTTLDGGYLLGGFSVSPASGNKTAKSFGSNDYWAVKLDKTGNIQWDKTYGGTQSDLLTTMIQLLDGSFVLGGYSYSSKSGNKTQDSRGNDDYWVVKTDSAGKMKWNTTLGGDSYDELSCLLQGHNGNVTVGGSSKSNASGDKTQDNHDINENNNDYWIVKLNSKGKIIYDKTIGGFGEDELRGMYRDQYRTVLYGASNSAVSGDKTDPEAGAWVVAINNEHSIIWDETIPTYDPIGVVVLSNNRYALGTNDYTNSKYDYLIADIRFKNKDTSAVITANKVQPNISNTLPSTFTIYPNPAREMLYIQSKGKAKFELTDQSGKVLLTQTIDGNGIIKLNALSAGVYYIRNRATGATQKVLVVNK